MAQSKSPKTKGKFSFTRFFQKFQPGDSVAIVRELSQEYPYKKTMQGRTGKVISKQGSAYKIQIKDLNKLKTFILRPIHLRKIEEAPKK